MQRGGLCIVEGALFVVDDMVWRKSVPRKREEASKSARLEAVMEPCKT